MWDGAGRPGQDQSRTPSCSVQHCRLHTPPPPCSYYHLNCCSTATSNHNPVHDEYLQPPCYPFIAIHYPPTLPVDLYWNISNITHLLSKHWLSRSLDICIAINALFWYYSEIEGIWVHGHSFIISTWFISNIYNVPNVYENSNKTIQPSSVYSTLCRSEEHRGQQTNNIALNVL